MRKAILFYRVIFFFLLVSCSRYPAEVERILRYAGENRTELEKVLNHYRATGDSQKLKAAEYLIANMVNKYSFRGGNIERYDIMFHLFDSLYKEGIYSGETLIITHTWDSLVRNYGLINPASLEVVYDCRHIRSDFLIRNIESAFEAWQQLPAYISYDFERFCEYVLPYRAGNEPLEDYRERYFSEVRHLVDTATNCNDVITGFYNEFILSRNHWLSQSLWGYPIDIPVSKMEQGHRGACRHNVNFATLIMRACGLPVTSDHAIWANRSMGHEWNVLMLDSGRFIPFNAMNLEIEEFPYQPAKIFRKSFRYDDTLLRSLDREDVPPEFFNVGETDVTALYGNTQNITVPIQYPFSGTKKKRYGIICVFDNTKWRVAYWGKISSNRMYFNGMRENVVYLAAYYDQGRIVPASEPFLLQADGSLQFFKSDRENLQTMHLDRKYPILIRVIEHARELVQTTAEAANSPDFSDRKIFFTIHEPPSPKIIDSLIHDSGKYRYVRFNSSFDLRANYAEVEFYGKRTKDSPEELLTGSIIGYPPIDKDDPNPYTNAMDGDLETWFQKRVETDGWVGLDLGKGNERIITRIRYCPRSDTNFILVGDTYELFYWDNERWNSAGTQEAATGILSFIDVPSGTLYWLRNLTRGNEERIFTYEDTQQVWW